MPEEDKGNGASLAVGCLALVVIVAYAAYKIIIWLSTQTS
jgi:hypothetical protein